MPSETFVRRQIASLNPGHTVGMARQIKDPDWVPGVPVLNIRAKSDNPIERLARTVGAWHIDRRSRALRSYLTEHKVEVVLAQWLNFGALWYPNVRGLGVRYFAHAHGYDITVNRLKKRWTKLLYQRLAQMDGVIVVSSLMRERLMSVAPMDPQRVHIIPYGVDVPEPVIRAESDVVTCLHVGRMVQKKAPLTTLRAFHNAHRERSNLRLEMIGDGPLLAQCRAYAAEHKLDSVVTFHGGQQNDFVRERLRAVDVFLLHSVTAASGDEEGLPVAILEAMAHGLPVISTRHAGIPDEVAHGMTGFLTDENDERGMTDHIVTLASSFRQRRQMGDAGRSRALDLFTAEREMSRLREVLFG